MRGRRWSEGAIALNFTMFAPGFEKGKGLVDYVGALRTLWTVAMALPSPISRSFSRTIARYAESSLFSS